MEITSRKELNFVIKADYMMNRGYFTPSILTKIKNLLMPDYIMNYLVLMRKINYLSTYVNRNSKAYFAKFKLAYYKIKYYHLGIKLSFSIGPQVLGYGCVIPHYGSLGVGSSNRLGNYCVLHTLTSITDNGKVIGNALYLSKGAKITSKIILGDNISIGANSVVNKSFPEGNIMIAGAPARIIKESQPWYIRDGKIYADRVRKIETLKKQLGL